MDKFTELAERVEQVAIARAGYYVSTNSFISGKDADIHAAASAFSVAAALRALATKESDHGTA